MSERSVANGRRMRKFKIGVIIIAISLTCFLSEGIVRLAGYRPWPRYKLFIGTPVRSHTLDSVVGWKKAPGQYRYKRMGREIVVTHWPDNLRATASKRVRRNRRIVLVGGSYIYGWGLNDDETLPWQLQIAYREVEWLNYATSAYGTYQSLLVLERYFATERTIPNLVIYGFNDFHESRNVAADRYQYVKALASPNERIKLPYVSIDQKGSLRRKVHTYPNWPLARYSAAIAYMQRAYNKLQVKGRAEQGPSVTRQLLVGMDQLTREKGSRLLVMAMIVSRKYFEFFSQKGILAVDCTPPISTPDLYLKDDHPSAKLNLHYAKCLESYLEKSKLLD